MFSFQYIFFNQLNFLLRYLVATHTEHYREKRIPLALSAHWRREAAPRQASPTPSDTQTLPPRPPPCSSRRVCVGSVPTTPIRPLGRRAPWNDRSCPVSSRRSYMLGRRSQVPFLASRVQLCSWSPFPASSLSHSSFRLVFFFTTLQGGMSD